MRPGDNKWTSTLFARRPETGEAVWAYQLTPHDLHDYDGVNEQILVDLPIDGRTRKVLIRPERNGYVYVMDRTTGEVLSANPYGFVNSSTGVDLKTGALLYNPDKETKVGKVVRDICPAAPGMKDWQPSAYSPKTGLLYIPHQNLCMDEEGVSANYIAGTPYVGMNVKMFPGPGGNRGVFEAWNPVTGKQVWSIKEDLPVWSGTVVTAGDVVFYGTMDGWFKAVDARTGDVRSGSSRRARESSASRSPTRTRRPSVRRRALRRRRMVRRDRRRRSRSARLLGRARLRQRDARSAVEDDEGRHALRVRAMTAYGRPSPPCSRRGRIRARGRRHRL